MDCLKHRQAIIEGIDSGKSLPDDTLNHINTCQSCKDMFDGHIDIARSLGSEYELDSSILPEHLHERIVNECKAVSPGVATVSNRRSALRISVIVSIAATLLIAVSLWHFMSPRVETGGTPDIKSLQPSGGSLVVAWLVTRETNTPDQAAIAVDQGFDESDSFATLIPEQIESWYADLEDYCNELPESDQDD